ncbi:MAG: glycosyltransferase family 2 protein [Candidatus Omnitrophota bacterium]
MTKISAVIITKNEENKIMACLDSVKKFVDEVIIVDDLSSDNTVTISQSFGAKVVISDSKGKEFAQQRNIGIDNASGDWIVQMDADEVIPLATASKIKDAINSPGDHVAFEIRRQNFFLGHPIRYCGNYGFCLKIFKKGYGRYNGNIHEKLSIDGKIGKIDADINHYPFNSIYQFIERMNRYTESESVNFTSDPNINLKRIKYELTIKSLKKFWKLYIRKKGYKDGMYGFIWCVLNVIGPQVRWIKIWEKTRDDCRYNQ